VASPIARRGTLDVTPAELGDEAGVARMRHRVRLKGIGRMWVHLDGPLVNDGSAVSEDDGLDILLPAIGETAHRIRVVTEEDGARVAVWIDRRDAWESVVARVKLEGNGTTAAGAAGVWLDAGAPVRVEEERPDRTRRLVELRDDSVAVRGAMPAAHLGHVWTVPHDEQRGTEMFNRCPLALWKPPQDRRPQRWIMGGAEIRVAPADEAVVLATSQEVLTVAVVAQGADWTEIELLRPYARIRGHVESVMLALREDEEIGLGGCMGQGFGMSHADRIDVPAGTCLYDRANGEVVGVATETQVRLGARARPGSEWSMVYVDTRWSIASMYVRDGGRDPARPVLDSCVAARR
jgi:hypothetical protein